MTLESLLFLRQLALFKCKLRVIDADQTNFLNPRQAFLLLLSGETAGRRGRSFRFGLTRDSILSSQEARLPLHESIPTVGGFLF